MNRKKTIYLVIFSVIVLLTAFIVYMVVDIQDNLNMLDAIPISDVNLFQTDDGTYYGEYEVFPISVKLTVTVENHEITSIDIYEHKNGRGDSAESITDRVIGAQSLEVDSVAGATYSSKVILLAIKNALD